MEMNSNSLTLDLHELIQRYFDKCYSSLLNEAQHSLFAKSNEIYGELYYYSAAKLLKYLNLTEDEHFLDVGSGLGKIIFQVFITTPVCSVTGIEINQERHAIAYTIMKMIENDLPHIFTHKRKLHLINDDFLKNSFDNITIAYICSTVFSFDLLCAIGNKLNDMKNVHTVVSFRKLPNLRKFKMERKLFFQASWDHTPCYLYKRCI